MLSVCYFKRIAYVTKQYINVVKNSQVKFPWQGKKYIRQWERQWAYSCCKEI